MKNDEKPLADPYVVLREEFDDWAILFNCDTGRGFGLSPTGVYVWKLLDGEHTTDDLLKEILASDNMYECGLGICAVATCGTGNNPNWCGGGSTGCCSC